ncbi:MAG TPA: hypothetical protein VD833_02080 [Vicinamibacterales bacterium]|nr:hypothetical protein [Vicinamibacterales bacterium]
MKRAAPLAATLIAGFLQTQPGQPVTLELRVFHGYEEVTRRVRATVHRAGDRGEAVAQRDPAEGSLEFALPEGIYDAQVFEEIDGKVLNIRWANRLVVMRYPDEGGRHLEVVNFANGYGALQVRPASGTPIELTLYPPGGRERPAAAAIQGTDYSLFVVPAGVYDLLVKVRGKSVWHTGVEVPLDRTRFWVLPEQG